MRFPYSARLVFRAWCEEDVAFAASLWQDPPVMRYMGGPMTEGQVRARLGAEMDRQRALGVQYWPMFFRDGRGFVGCAGLRPWHDEPNVFEVGVHVARPFWGERLGTEAARAVMRFAFDELGVEALTAGHGRGHANSKAMLERVGFRFTHQEPWGTQGVLHPFYRLKRSEYFAA